MLLGCSSAQVFRFHGGQCEHFAPANDTGSTRVSWDFRVIPLAVWRDEFGGRIGEYPAETTADDRLGCKGARGENAGEEL